MSNTVNEKVEEIDKKGDTPSKWFTKKWKLTASGIIVVAILLAGVSYYQATHFNGHITINGSSVGGMTADKAIKKLETAVSKNEVYIGQTKILDGKDTNMGFTTEDLLNVKKLLKSQWSFFPSSKKINYSLTPASVDQNRSQALKNQTEDKLTLMNKSLQAPQDAEAHLVNGKITVSKSNNGKQYDITSLMGNYQKQEENSEIHLNPVYIQPVKENSPVVQKEEKMLQGLLQQSINYTVQGKAYTLKGSDLIKNAAVSKTMQVTIDQTAIKNALAQINASQSTLNKPFSFKTHTGSVISVQGQTYGWEINVGKEAQLIQDAFAKGEKSLTAANIYGNGWGSKAIGYQTTANNGIGGTYAEVSISEQRAYFYRNGALVFTTNVVTGRHNTNEDTPKGVWYILYKKSPSTLTGSEVGNPHYSVKVAYWAPFTNGGCGFHDASWRKNWSSTAYLTAGSGGCVNTPPSVMKTVYNNLSTFEPVIVY